jgi:23S rRNA U2552 (ribose-2'-O)-methylase RlmE/FtsJ
MEDISAQAAKQPISEVSHARAIHFCLLDPEFTTEHLRTSGAQSAATLLGPAKALVTTTLTSLFRQVGTMRRAALRTVAWALVFLFPSLVLGPHRPRAPSSAIKAEMKARLDL